MLRSEFQFFPIFNCPNIRNWNKISEKKNHQIHSCILFNLVWINFLFSIFHTRLVWEKYHWNHFSFGILSNRRKQHQNIKSHTFTAYFALYTWHSNFHAFIRYVFAFKINQHFGKQEQQEIRVWNPKGTKSWQKIVAKYIDLSRNVKLETADFSNTLCDKSILCGNIFGTRYIFHFFFVDFGILLVHFLYLPNISPEKYSNNDSIM